MTTTTQTSGDSRRTRQRSHSVSSDRFVLTLWTTDPAVAGLADRGGIDRVGVDLETIGKADRQRGRATWISPHLPHDLLTVGRELDQAQLFARVNPLHRQSADEIEMVLAVGAQVLMVPMVSTPHEAADFAGLVDGRARVVVLVERREAVASLADIASIPGVDEIHLGLNDLALSLGLHNRWAALAGDLVADAAACVGAMGKPFGFGGIGRAFDATLPIPSDLVYAEYARTGATRALIARSFRAAGGDLASETERARRRLGEWQSRPLEALMAAHAELGRLVQHAGGW